MEKIIVRVEPVWRRSPLTSRNISSSPGWATSSRVTSQGPRGPKLSWLLPLIHWPERFDWKVRSETSLNTA